MAAAAAIATSTIPSFHNDFLESGNDFREITTTIAKDTNALEEIEATVAARYSQYNNDVSIMYQLWETHKDKIEKYSRAGTLLRAREFNHRYITLRQELTEIVSSPYTSDEDRIVAQNALLLSSGEPIEGEEEDEYELYSSDEEEDYDSDEEEEDDEYDENNHPQEDEAHQPQENNNPHGELDEAEAGPEDNEEEDEYYEENINEDEIDFDEDDYSDYEEDDEEEE